MKKYIKKDVEFGDKLIKNVPVIQYYQQTRKHGEEEWKWTPKRDHYYSLKTMLKLSEINEFMKKNKIKSTYYEFFEEE